jgi:hypothetical protein
MGLHVAIAPDHSGAFDRVIGPPARVHDTTQSPGNILAVGRGVSVWYSPASRLEQTELGNLPKRLGATLQVGHTDNLRVPDSA